MSSKPTPFYTQAAMLDRYIHAADPSSDPEMIKIVLEILKTKSDLRSYFFRSGPSVVWAKILWENDFFSYPPEPEKTTNGLLLAPWDVQNYLISIAPQVPEIVIKHIQTINGHAWYLSRAIEAVNKIPSAEAEKVLPIIINWLNDPTKLEILCDQAVVLMNFMIENSHWESALELLKILSAPHSEQARPPRLGSYLLRDKLFGPKQDRSSAFDLLRNKQPKNVILILENHLINSLKNEAEQPIEEFYSWWRSAIEDTEQDVLDTYNDVILCALRDTLDVFSRADHSSAEVIINGYLESFYSIFRRLGLYLLWRNKDIFSNLISKELLKQDNLYSVDIHHEYFLLLEYCFRLLSISDKKLLVGMILDGPDKTNLNKLADWAEREYGENRDKYLSLHTKSWIRDRLWMIKDELEEKVKIILDDLIAEGGKPDHPSFLSWSSGFYSIIDVSPFPEQELSEASPEELLVRIKNWQPSPEKHFSEERISYIGLARKVAELFHADPQRYSTHINEIALLRPEYASAIINHWINPENKYLISWPIAIELCRYLLTDLKVWDDPQKNSIDEETWRDVRLSISRLFLVGVSDNNQLAPIEYLPDIRDMLLQLINDSDPSSELDRPKEGMFGHDDPESVALNSVRPVSIGALILYAIRKRKVDNKSSKVESLENVVREALANKVNTRLDTSRAVHSVFGKYLPSLHWLDKEWVKENIDIIFPKEIDEESKWFFVSAWDGYILNRYNAIMFNLLRQKYQQAIYFIAQGYKSKSHLQYVDHLAVHLAFDYLSIDNIEKLPNNQEILLKEFINTTQPEIRGKAAWAFWIICRENPNERDKYWRKAKEIWEWRAREAAISNHTPEFNLEMGEFSRLLLVAPINENIVTLRPLLDGLLPYMQGSEFRDLCWNSVEAFLARQIDYDPIRVIRFYRLMFEQKANPPKWIFHSDEAKKIIKLAAENPPSRADTLNLIDLLARWNDFTFRYIYDQYS